MSEEILKALIQLFAVISKQNGGVTEGERRYVLKFFEEQLNHESIPEYISLYDKFSGYGTKHESHNSNSTSLKDSLRALAVSKKINKTLTQRQKVIALIEAIGLIHSDEHVSEQEMIVLETISSVFNISDTTLQLTRQFVTGEELQGFDEYTTLIAGRELEVTADVQFWPQDISGRLVFIRIEEVDLYFVKYDGNEELILNSMTMIPDKPYLFSVGSTIKLPKGLSIYYSDIITRFTSSSSNGKLSFIVNNLEFNFPNGYVGIHKIDIQESSGNLVGILGSSGSGKTTLLKLLAGILEPSNGTIRINGKDVIQDAEELEGLIGYIPQDDILIEDLTVYQNLYFNAKLSLSGLSEDEITRKIGKILTDLGLEHTKDLKVGTLLNQKISGGQRKRLNIALELIRQPSVLFVDEPTSGLSSRDSENVIDLLKQLTLLGKLIFAVIHQPSSDIYKMFDKVIILDNGGYPIFYGNPLEAISYFKSIAHQLDQSRVICETCGTVTAEQIFNIVDAKVVDEYGNFSDKRKIDPVKWYQHFKQNIRLARVTEIAEAPNSSFKIPSLLRQFLIFLQRDVLAKIADHQYLLVNLLEAPLLAAILAYIIRYSNSTSGEYNFQHNDNIPAYFLMSIIVALFIGLSVSAEEIIKDRKLRERERFLNLSESSYLLSKVTLLFTLSAFQVVSFVLIGNFILEIKGMTFHFWLILFSCAALANVIGLNISSAFKSAVTVYIIIPIILIPQMILSGLLFNFDKLNSNISSKEYVPLLGDLMASRWALEAMSVLQYVYNPYEWPLYELEGDASNANYKTAYWSKELENKVNFIANNFLDSSAQVISQIDNSLILLQNEIAKESFKGALSANLDSLLNKRNIGPKTLLLLYQYLNDVENHYNTILRESIRNKDKLLSILISSDEFEYAPDELKKLHYNEKVAELVRNTNARHRIIEHDNRLIRKIDFIYFKPDTERSPINYRTHFFAPSKLFLGFEIPTFSFNVGVIWLMTLAAYLLLYFKVFEKFSQLRTLSRP
jgi:ABC-type multidrug transport system ATPase subunit